jgi:tetratricopeptide (TPR) repeat protein
MGIAGLRDSVLSLCGALLGWIGAHLWIIVAAAALIGGALMLRSFVRLRQRQAARARAARAKWVAHDLQEQVRERLADPGVAYANGFDYAPTIGACEVLSSDIEAATNSFLADAGGRRAAAKHLIRQRLLNGAGSDDTLWRQLGALSLLDSPNEAFKAYSRAVELKPDDPQGHMLLGVLALRTGRLKTAEAAFRRQVELAGEEGPAARHRARTMLGDVLLAKDEAEAALSAYEEARGEAAALAERDPINAAWQRDASIAHDRIGDVHLAAGRLDAALENYRASLTIAEKVAAVDPDDMERQRDLSVAHDRVGEVLERQGKLDEALASYRSGLALAETVAQREPERIARQWDVSVSLDRIGDILLVQGKTQEALAAHRRGLRIAEEAAETEPERTAWQRDLAVTYHKLGTLEALEGNPAEAREYLERGRAIIARLNGIAAQQAQWRADLARFDQALSSLGP